MGVTILTTFIYAFASVCMNVLGIAIYYVGYRKQSDVGARGDMDEYEEYFDSLDEGEEALSYEEFRAALSA